VAQVVLNRVDRPAYPDTICAVVYQNQTWAGRCQFSFACDGIEDQIRSPKAYAIAKRIASEVSSGKIRLDTIGTATNYHADNVHRPGQRQCDRWRKSERTFSIDRGQTAGPDDVPV
jgi:spore germination cell wall hydrolase CwlJ-like protein